MYTIDAPRTAIFLKVGLAFVLCLGLADAMTLALAYWPGRTFDGETSGVWTALANDVAQGVFYRPVFSDNGYGGTRYMPLFFVIHGALIRFSDAPTLSGLVLMQASVVLMVAAIARLLIQNGVGRGWAIAVAMLTYTTTLYQQYLTDVNCDYLATALGLWGISLFLGKKTHYSGVDAGLRHAELLGSVLFVAAFFTKFSSIYAPGAVFLALILSGYWRKAFIFSAVSLALLSATALALHWLSQGHMLAALTATATGGTDVAYALGFGRRFIKELFVFHPAVGVCFVLALMKWIMDGPGRWRAPLHLMFILTALVTLVIFSSRGIAGNHTIPLQAVSLVMMGLALKDGRGQRTALAAGFMVLGSIIVATWLPGIPSVRETVVGRANPSVSDIRDVLGRHVPANGVVFSQHPIYPIVAGYPIYALDFYNLTGFIRSGHPAGTDFKARLERGAFDVLIVHAPNRELHLGPEAVPFTFSDHYEIADRLGRYTIMVPASDTSNTPASGD